MTSKRASVGPEVKKSSHVGVPGAVEARDEGEPRVVVEEHEPRLMDRLDRHAVVPRPISGGFLQIAQRGPQGFALAGLDPEEQAELAGGTDAHTRAGSFADIRRHSFLLWMPAKPCAPRAPGHHLDGVNAATA